MDEEIKANSYTTNTMDNNNEAGTQVMTEHKASNLNANVAKIEDYSCDKKNENNLENDMSDKRNNKRDNNVNENVFSQDDKMTNNVNGNEERKSNKAENDLMPPPTLPPNKTDLKKNKKIKPQSVNELNDSKSVTSDSDLENAQYEIHKSSSKKNYRRNFSTENRNCRDNNEDEQVIKQISPQGTPTKEDELDVNDKWLINLCNEPGKLKDNLTTNVEQISRMNHTQMQRDMQMKFRKEEYSDLRWWIANEIKEKLDKNDEWRIKRPIKSRTICDDIGRLIKMYSVLDKIISIDQYEKKSINQIFAKKENKKDENNESGNDEIEIKQDDESNAKNEDMGNNNKYTNNKERSAVKRTTSPLTIDYSSEDNDTYEDASMITPRMSRIKTSAKRQLLQKDINKSYDPEEDKPQALSTIGKNSKVLRNGHNEKENNYINLSEQKNTMQSQDNVMETILNSNISHERMKGIEEDTNTWKDKVLSEMKLVIQDNLEKSEKKMKELSDNLAKEKETLWKIVKKQDDIIKSLRREVDDMKKAKLVEDKKKNYCSDLSSSNSNNMIVDNELDWDDDERIKQITEQAEKDKKERENERMRSNMLNDNSKDSKHQFPPSQFSSEKTSGNSQQAQQPQNQWSNLTNNRNNKFNRDKTNNNNWSSTQNNTRKNYTSNFSSRRNNYRYHHSDNYDGYYHNGNYNRYYDNDGYLTQHPRRNNRVWNRSNDSRNHEAMYCKNQLYFGNVHVNKTKEDVSQLFEEKGFTIKNISQLKTKHSYFKSFQIEIEEDQMKNALESKTWPKAIIIRQFKKLERITGDSYENYYNNQTQQPQTNINTQHSHQTQSK